MFQKIVSLIILLLFLPFFLIVGILIFIFDGRPILFKQKRIGKNDKEFYMYKFRTMINNLGDIPKAYIKQPQLIITITGRYLRKYSIDELPQFLNVIKGDMDLIGYRPCLPNEIEVINQRKKYQLNRYKPGITGWAQVNGRDNIEVDEKVYLDSFYYKNHSLYLDIKILFLTVLLVILRKDVSH